MNTLTIPYNQAPTNFQKGQTTDIRRSLVNLCYHWPLFVIGLLLAFSALFFYLKFAKPIFEIRAVMVIKDDKKAAEQRSVLQEIDLSNSSNSIDNEMEVLQSKALMNQVVNDLQLWAIYRREEGFRVFDLYDQSPVKITVTNSDKKFDEQELDILIKNERSFQLITRNGYVRTIAFGKHFKVNSRILKLDKATAHANYVGQSIKINLYDPEKVALQYQKSVKITLPNKLSTAIVLTVDAENEQKGKDILNRLIFNYKSAGTAKKNGEARSTINFIDQRLSSLTNELTDAEKGIEKFKSTRGLTDISSESKISLENLQANDARLNEINIQLSVVEGIERYINIPQNSGKIPATLGIMDAALNSLIEKLSQLQLQKERLLATTPETNPDFEPINRQIITTKAAIKENIKSIRASLHNTKIKLQTFNSGFESSIKNIPTQERQYISIKRQQAIKESLYTYLLQKREEVSVSYASTLTDNDIVDQAFAASASVPKKPLAFAIALLFGLGFPAGLVLGRNSGHQTITDLDEVRSVVNINILGEMPFESSNSKGVVNFDNSTAMVEQLRGMRINIDRICRRKESGRIILITSSVPREGKSFMSYNLASSLAASGKKVIILEMDLRKPKIVKRIHLPREHPGLTDFLSGQAFISDVIQKTESMPNLHIIGSGSQVPNPSQLLEKRSLENLLTTLKENYDDIIIDSPPVHLIPDALILSQFTDLT